MVLFKKPDNKFESVLDHVVEACLDYVYTYDHNRLLSDIPPNDQLDLVKRFTHLRDQEFFDKRRELYQKIFRDAFMRNGKVIPPVPSGQKRHRFIICGTYFSGKTDFLNALFRKDKAVPPEIQQRFDMVNNKHAITVDLTKIRDALPEYQEAKLNGYPYPASVVRGEMDAIASLMLNTAKLCGYNIIDYSRSHTLPLTDDDIDLMKGASRKRSDVTKKYYEPEYQLYSVAVNANPEVVVDQVEIGEISADKDMCIKKAERAARDLSRTGSFQKLMRQSKDSFLVWDNGEKVKDGRFSVVASAKNGLLNVENWERWNRFRKQQFVELLPSKGEGFSK